MAEFEREPITRLLDKAGSIIDKYETISRETGGDFNIFEIADISTKETTVCRVLAELLSPLGHHGQKGDYLEIFLRYYLRYNFAKAEIEKARVTREYPADGRRIDIVIEVGGRFIPIEVKIYAGEGIDQCYDYFNYAKRMDGKARVVYLTLYGHLPSEYSAKDLSDNKILPLSFAYDVLGWLEKCLALPETIRKAPIREILIQLVSAIKNLTNQMEDRPMTDMVALLSESPQNMRNAEAIAISRNECKAEMTTRLFRAIEKGAGRETANIWDNEPVIKRYFAENKATWPAIAFMFRRVRANVNVLFVIELGYELLFCGLLVASDKGYDGWLLTDDEGERLNLAPKGKNTHWSKKFQSFPDCSEHPNFKNHNDAFYNLFDGVFFNEYVKKCIARINELWEQWENEIVDGKEHEE